jgi:glycosyltransferase involved in cell wall biosynthesis
MMPEPRKEERSPSLTIIAPRIASFDWSAVMVDYFCALLGDSDSVNVVTGWSDECSSFGGNNFDFLDPKLTVSVALREAARRRQLAKRVLLLDPNFVNVRALRTLVGEDGRVFTLVNGGAFQPHDFDHQFMPRWAERICEYEGGFFGLCDRIIVPSQHARRLFIKRFPQLAAILDVIPYPLRKRRFPHPLRSMKQGVIFASRPSIEKGIDIVKALIARGRSITQIFGVSEQPYFRALRKHLCVLIPARAELFGYVAIEAIQAGTIPIIPKALSYPEFIDFPDWLFLSPNVGDHTVEEIEYRLTQVERLTDNEYASIIERCQDRIRLVFARQDEKFISVFNS